MTDKFYVCLSIYQRPDLLLVKKLLEIGYNSFIIFQFFIQLQSNFVSNNSLDVMLYKLQLFDKSSFWFLRFLILAFNNFVNFAFIFVFDVVKLHVVHK